MTESSKMSDEERSVNEEETPEEEEKKDEEGKKYIFIGFHLFDFILHLFAWIHQGSFWGSRCYQKAIGVIMCVFVKTVEQ